MDGQVLFISRGKSGHVLYERDNQAIRFYYELGGGNCLAIIYVPTTEEWLHQTGMPVHDRLSVLTYIANQAIKKQAPNSQYIIRENCIEIISS